MIRLAPVIQGYWLKIGVKADIVPLDQSAWNPMRRGGPNRGPVDALVGQACLQNHSGNVVVAQGFQSAFSSSGNQFLLTAGVEPSPEVDSLVQSALSEPDEAKRREIISKMIQLTLDAYMSLVIGTVPTMAGLGPRLDIDLPWNAMSIPMYAEAAKHRN